jgi:hypothetical protein
MPRKAAGYSQEYKVPPLARQSGASVLRALDNLDAAVSKLSEVVDKIVAQPCETASSTEQAATLVPSEILPSLIISAVPPAPPIHVVTDKQPAPPLESPRPTVEPESQLGFAERLLSAQHRSQR